MSAMAGVCFLLTLILPLANTHHVANTRDQDTHHVIQKSDLDVTDWLPVTILADLEPIDDEPEMSGDLDSGNETSNTSLYTLPSVITSSLEHEYVEDADGVTRRITSYYQVHVTSGSKAVGIRIWHPRAWDLSSEGHKEINQGQRWAQGHRPRSKRGTARDTCFGTYLLTTVVS